MKNFLKTSLALALVLFAASSACYAAAVPEIDPQSGIAGLALISGAVMILRSRRKS